MRYADDSRGRPFSKDPAVVFFGGAYFLYYSIPPFGDGRVGDGWAIGIARSTDLEEWHKVGELLPADACERQGVCAPGAVVLRSQVHLFYQTYGNGPKDALCHAVSANGLHFTRNPSNPIFAPTGGWNNGRAIDADVITVGDTLRLYFATRDPAGRVQKLGVASAPLDGGFGRDQWRQECAKAILEPELPWEQDCIEAAAVCQHEGRFFMFYGGAYNNAPQQIGCAVSNDGLNWHRLGDQPFLPNGRPGDWNASESGHPFVFTAPDGRTWLFFQGNNDNGQTWFLSKAEIDWRDGLPILENPL